MISTFISGTVIYNVIDVIASVFLVVIIISAAVHRNEKFSTFYFMGGAILVLASISLRILGRSMNLYLLQFTDKTAEANTILFVINIVAFVMAGLSCGIFFIHADGDRNISFSLNVKSFMERFTAAVILLTLIVCFIKSYYYIMPVSFIVILLTGLAICLTDSKFRFNKAIFTAAVMMPVFSNILSLIDSHLRFNGIAMTLMYAVMYMMFFSYVDKALMEKELELANSKVQLLTEQISPHFISNSLQVIEGMCDTDPDEVKPAIRMFSRYLRGNLESMTDTEMVPFSRELEHAKTYLALEEAGREDPFTVQYKLNAGDFMIPTLVLQPVVENAVRHGVKGGGQQGHIIIETSEHPGYYRISVSDNGGDFRATEESFGKSSNNRNHRSVAMANIKKRLELQCGGTVHMHNNGSGTTVMIEIPKRGGMK